MKTTPTVSRPGQRPTLEEAQRAVGGYVELVELADGSQLLIDEEGLLKQKPVNGEATRLTGGLHYIVGDVLHLVGEARWLD